MSLHPHKAIWISWYPHRRTSGICQEWGVPLKVIDSSRDGVIGWLCKGLKTLNMLRRWKPEVLFVQNPSLGLTILAVLSRSYFKYFLVVDAHNEGVKPFVRSSTFVRRLVRFLLKHADRTIVTNESLARVVTEVGGRAIILPDPLPAPTFTPEYKTFDQQQTNNVVVICTYAPDEPISDILAAAEKLPDKSFVCTGNIEKFNRLGLSAPGNVRFTGFLPDKDYWALLLSADVICDLTLMPDCLVCGAYEALAVGRPMVLSANSATRELFGSVAILSEPTPSTIAGALKYAIDNKSELSKKTAKEAEVYKVKWTSRSEQCVKTIKSEIARQDH
ncbi:MAG: glycosyltransferase family 4 protein [Marinobacter adhaerens]|uniref:Glycosyltransferase family 4 protein n=1 Tax=Marinobacter adhaerens TaxID=1033846 RepID=A0A844HYV3_9GAMM|nr:glycosyltransferase family 4 protein [Marinobacter adhaerens]